MKKYTLFILLLAFCLPLFGQTETTTKLELIPNNFIKQLNINDLKNSNNRFDLSGVAVYNSKIYVLADKSWNRYVYQIDTTATEFVIQNKQSINIVGRVDFEALDICSGTFYIANESNSTIYKMNIKGKELVKWDIQWKEFGIEVSKWRNRGIEGIAVDCKNSVLYLVKERGPARIFQIDLKNNQISEPFANLFDANGVDFSDVKFENGYLYLLHRRACRLLKINVNTKSTEYLSFKAVFHPQEQRLYKNDNPQYGLAESLLLTKDQIWIGIDNNGEEASEYGKKVGLKGNAPAFFIFKRP